MKHRNLIALLMACVLCAPLAGAWSKKGHQTVAYIAQRHLTQDAYWAINELLDGDNIVYWASWLDSARDYAEYSFTTPWHYINVNENETYETRLPANGGDAITGMKYCDKVFADPTATRQERQLAVKIAVHVLGDLHQPLHCGHRSDVGGNTLRIYYNDTQYVLHSFMDYTIVEECHPGWSYYNWAVNIDNLPAAEQQAIASGDYEDWAREGVQVAAYVYDYFTPWGDFDSYDIKVMTPFIERQFVRGGIRLGHYLNSIFDPEYAGVPCVDLQPAEALEADVYTLDGRCVMHGVTIDEARSQLAPGLYLHGRTKIAVTR